MNSPQCLTCAGRATPVAWGKPDASAAAGLVRLGGTIVPGSPNATWRCSGSSLTSWPISAARATVT